MAIIDTSVLVPLFDRGHPHHDEARRLVSGHTIWHVTGGVLAEFTQVIRRLAQDRHGNGNEAARRALVALRETPGFRDLGDTDAEWTAHIYHTNPGLSYVDAWGISLALVRNEPLLTLDEGHRQIAAGLA